MLIGMTLVAIGFGLAMIRNRVADRCFNNVLASHLMWLSSWLAFLFGFVFAFNSLVSR